MIFRVADICFSYNSHPVLTNVTFSLDKGQILCVLGMNGAGKSTLLKCLNRILKSETGSVMVEEEDIFRMSRNDVARHMGYVAQKHPETRMSVFETVLMGRKPHIKWALTARDYDLVEKIIDQIGIGDLAMRPVSSLSGGEVQKVAIARALAQSPSVLLLDEPTSSLDLKNQLEVMGLIRRVVTGRGLTAVIVIHDINIAMRFGDFFLFLKNHRIHSLSASECISEEMIRQIYGVDVVLKKINGHRVAVPL